MESRRQSISCGNGRRFLQKARGICKREKRNRTISQRRNPLTKDLVLGAGLEPACLSAYAPQTYLAAIPPPELLNLECGQNLPSICVAWQPVLLFLMLNRPEPLQLTNAGIPT